MYTLSKIAEYYFSPKKKYQYNNKNTQRQPPAFKAYLFVVKGLDLAIPSRRKYLVETKFSNKLWNAPFADMDQVQKNMMQRVQLLPCWAKINLNNGDKRLCIEFINNKHKG